MSDLTIPVWPRRPLLSEQIQSMITPDDTSYVSSEMLCAWLDRARTLEWAAQVNRSSRPIVTRQWTSRRGLWWRIRRWWRSRS